MEQVVLQGSLDFGKKCPLGLYLNLISLFWVLLGAL